MFLSGIISRKKKQGQLSPVLENLLMWLDGEDFTNSPQTTTWQDKSTANNDGTPAGFAYTTISGSSGYGGVIFAGTDDCVACPAMFNIANGISVLVRFKISAQSSGYRKIFSYSNFTEYTPNYHGFNLTVLANSTTLELIAYNDTSYTIQTPLVLNKEYIAQVDYTTDNKLIMRLNGVIIDTVNVPTRPSINTSVPFVLGKVSSSDLYIGKIYDCLCYSGDLTPTQHTQNYNYILSAVVKNLVVPAANAVSVLNIPTYDTSNQPAHPSIVYFSSGWNGYKYWLVMTPLPGGANTYENPSIVASNDNVTWGVPDGVTNPLVSSPGGGSHNCDPELFYNAATDELRLYYVESNNFDRSYIKYIKSSDGVNWSAIQTLITDTRVLYGILSPAVDKVETKYYMWCVNAGNSGYNNQDSTIELRESDDGLSWESPVTCTFTQVGYIPWHIYIRYIPSKDEYWAIISAYPTGSDSTNTILFFAKSTDRVNWTTYDTPIITKGTTGAWDATGIYRSSFVYDVSTDTMLIWYNGWLAATYKIGYTTLDCDYLP